MNHFFQSRITHFFDTTSNSSSSNIANHRVNPSFKSSANMYIQNTGGLRTKSNVFYCNSSSSDYNIISLTETWLNSGHNSSEFFDDTFNVFRKDRYETASTYERGGGVLIAVRSYLICNDIILNNTNNIECVCVKISIANNSNVFVYNAYIPPNAISDVYSCHLRAITAVHGMANPTDTIIVTGDFNIPCANWVFEESHSNVLLPTSVEPPFAAEFLNG